MDSITQAALGASIGEAVLGRKVGRKAALWGAFFGTLPDLDVLVDPFVSDVEALLAHRGPTHALLFSFVAAPVLGWMLARVHPRSEAGAVDWMKLVFWALLTHPLLDAFTSYGTQLLLPFSRHPVAWSTISIVDPLYTLPLLAGLLAAYLMRSRPKWRLRANQLGLVISTAYLALSGVHKLSVDRILLESARQAGIDAKAAISSPALFTNLVWAGLIDDGSRVWYGTYAVLDSDRTVSFRPIDKRSDLFERLEESEARDVLLWFTRGFYSAGLERGELVVKDWHVGRLDLWLTDDGEPIFQFRVTTDPSTGRVNGFETLNPDVGDRTFGGTMRHLWRRMLGRTIRDSES